MIIPPVISDEKMMQECLRLAKQGMGRTSPNPMVGSVIVKDGQIIGKGYHHKVGQAHAEVDALNSCTVNTEGATVYVNLEPCCHFGKTPPCVDALLAAKVKRVVTGVLDPNPLVAGKGIDALRRAGVAVQTGILSAECDHLNRIFFYWVRNKRPFIALKVGCSADYKIAVRSGVRTHITGQESLHMAHELRRQFDAILVGIDTVIADDPALTCRLSEGGRDPLRIILDSTLRIPLSARVLADSNVIIICGPSAGSDEYKERSKKHEVVALPISAAGTINLDALQSFLFTRGVQSVLVEGGRKIFDSFVAGKYFQEWHIFQSCSLLGPQALPVLSDVPLFQSFLQKSVLKSCGEDTYFYYSV